ncbi:hypothetical protein J3Q64DRAFT_1698958 [Phycomyces blakesleeanus]|uniref:Arrestin-like N-terminal domain-containing protein n=2 Tax=Phycomyces blakesleeanus TaxID=4837 RepID=A0A162U3U3_PHYB8|nr:hypothetical protein PHYBLDRAFT_168573 [Phycomyces blakesleeanus NRRL 1555(-)]OAD73222.1 hypothetical protein PHYBLDRAFT_168573 [Phycomyces blakesleeanus NRRL 1555(-)]|eukprot:XP_018291262.1 hypothetical protein PHYBLDRAFT_168573 [Phycomyces blakesleeanus NRRL 1555(-)]
MARLISVSKAIAFSRPSFKYQEVYRKPKVGLTLHSAPRITSRGEQYYQPGDTVNGALDVLVLTGRYCTGFKVKLSIKEKIDLSKLGIPNCTKEKCLLSHTLSLYHGPNDKELNKGPFLFMEPKPGKLSLSFSFVLPNVNYPPSFSIGVISCSMVIEGWFEEFDEPKIYGPPIELNFLPATQMMLSDRTPTVTDLVLPDRSTLKMAFLKVYDHTKLPHSIIVRLADTTDGFYNYLTQQKHEFHISLKRVALIKWRKKAYRIETVVCKQNCSLSRVLHDGPSWEEVKAVEVSLDIPPNRGMMALNYSKLYTIKYELCLKISVPFGYFFVFERDLISIPVEFGTLKAEPSDQTGLLSYADKRVTLGNQIMEPDEIKQMCLFAESSKKGEPENLLGLQYSVLR